MSGSVVGVASVRTDVHHCVTCRTCVSRVKHSEVVDCACCAWLVGCWLLVSESVITISECCLDH
jgi:hypothetical protein